MLGRTLGSAVRYYLVADFAIGPALVGGALAGWTTFVLGTASSWYFGVPWPLSMAAVGVSWYMIGWGVWRFSRWALRLAARGRAPSLPVAS